jgi:hypothetical protein
VRHGRLPGAELGGAAAGAGVKTAGLGTGALTLWVYGILAGRYGLPVMPPEIAAIIAGLLMEGADVVKAWLEGQRTQGAL